jgi:hypothetical protein
MTKAPHRPEPEPDEPDATGAVASQPTPAPSTPSPTRQLTFGEKAVGLTFNPSGDPTVQKLKELYAEIIDICHAGREKVNQGRITAAPQQHEAARLWSIAITEAQGAQMWAVKAATWKD